jgi:hypothetical protein
LLQQVPTYEQRPSTQLPTGKAWTIEYVLMLLQIRKLQEEATASLPSLDILFGSEAGSLQKLDWSSQYSRKLQKRLEDLEKKHGREIGVGATGEPVRWRPEDPLFQKAYRSLRLVEMEKLQRQTEAQVHELLYLQSCASKLGDRPGDLKKVRKEMERCRGRVRSALGRLKQWKEDLVEAVVFGKPSELEKDSADPEFGTSETAGDEDFRVDEILRGDFPWLDEGSESGMQGSQALRLKRKLVSLEEDKKRGEEEKVLVEMEMKRTVFRYREQIESLKENAVYLEREKEKSANDACRMRYAEGVLTILSLKRRRLEGLLGRADALFRRSLSDLLQSEEMGAAVGRASGPSSIFEGEFEADWESELDDDL